MKLRNTLMSVGYSWSQIKTEVNQNQEDYKSSFAELLSEDKSFTLHHRNVQKLATEMYKVKNELCQKIMLDLFKEVRHP